MRESLIRDALRRIQDIVAESTGKQLSDDGEKQLESLLGAVLGATQPESAGENFSQRNVTMLFADLRGFTAITANYPAGVVLDLLNRCFVTMSEIVVRHRGTIDKFMGDSIMVIFSGGSPLEDVRRALLCAVDMQVGMAWLNRNKKNGVPELFMGIGINTGNVMAGVLGSDLYSAYTVIGEDVNLTSRIEAFSLRGQVLISESTAALCGDFARTGEPVEVFVKGRPERVRVREVLGIPSVDKEVPRQEVRRSPRVEVSLPFSYELVEEKIIRPGTARGVIRDIGYHGMLAELEDGGEIALFAELKLEIDLPMLGFLARDVYARVVKVVQKRERQLIGLEFTSLGAEANGQIQLFVQMLIQGGEAGALRRY
jgi:adenylate cyclase